MNSSCKCQTDFVSIPSSPRQPNLVGRSRVSRARRTSEPRKAGSQATKYTKNSSHKILLKTAATTFVHTFEYTFLPPAVSCGPSRRTRSEIRRMYQTVWYPTRRQTAGTYEAAHHIYQVFKSFYKTPYFLYVCTFLAVSIASLSFFFTSSSSVAWVAATSARRASCSWRCHTQQGKAADMHGGEDGKGEAGLN